MPWQQMAEPAWLTGPKDWVAIEAREGREARRCPALLRNAIIWRREALAEDQPMVRQPEGRYHVERMLELLERVAARLGVVV
ncbi:MAG: hypothetical protein ACYC2H_09995 [Thermoplasmatota archaeon]